MIEGRVDARLEATLSLDVQRPGGRPCTIEAVVDTDYSEFLTLPPDRVSELGLTRKHQGSARLADGSEIAFDVYDAELVWDGQMVAVLVDAAETTPLVGMALLEGHELRIEARTGGRVLIDSLPS
ncbi:MAG: clan AA aspartic protease [Acidimicrobiaceae bacterium]|nr:clan AA aspartic protease [Acidimicrobiaceae bacterium]MYA75020.1 clan AA aspartic protease [Acidimicrobiaceae bacterium]MYC43229.1 clan AA aspartic protease [Acidimicrobiaceae bacterium]MYG55424.1 clan AA aspartic protease [Acidimicrobiaceae bacterium]MYJ99357.1 clan AA aspartic protease [Acidimicrobiaceae bacterium]